jgi:hypothetical protein
MYTPGRPYRKKRASPMKRMGLYDAGRGIANRLVRLFLLKMSGPAYAPARITEGLYIAGELAGLLRLLFLKAELDLRWRSTNSRLFFSSNRVNFTRFVSFLAKFVIVSMSIFIKKIFSEKY